MEMENCICGDKTQESIDKCVICLHDKLIPLALWEREKRCEVHHIKRILICGKGEKICRTCSDAGWYSTAGFGGPTQHINEMTGEVRRIPYPKCDDPPW